MPTAGDRVFCDTNVLLAATDRSRAEHQAATRFLNGCAEHGVDCYTAPQILREYLVVATRPVAANGLGLGIDQAQGNLRAWRRRAYLLDEDAAVSDRLFALLGEVACSGKRIHDGNVVALMLRHGITLLVTANLADYRDLAAATGIEVQHPEAVAFRA